MIKTKSFYKASLLAVTLVLGACSSTPSQEISSQSTSYQAIAEEIGPDGLIYTPTIEGNKYIVSGYIGEELNVVISNQYNGVEIIGIGNEAFAGKQLTSITIPESVTQIGDRALAGNQLTSVIIPGSVTRIGNGSFAYNLLTSVTISDSVTYLGDYAFFSNLLPSVTIPSSVTYIGDGAFYFNRLKMITIPNSVTQIGGWAFEYNEISTANIPNSVILIGAYAFANNPIINIYIEHSEQPEGWHPVWGGDVDISKIMWGQPRP